MSKVSGNLLYKCRRCGEIKIDSHTPNMALSIAYAINECTKEELHVNMLSVHCCQDGKVGVADLIGGDFDKEVVI